MVPLVGMFASLIPHFIRDRPSQDVHLRFAPIPNFPPEFYSPLGTTKKAPFGACFWRPYGDSNSGYCRERAVS